MNRDIYFAPTCNFLTFNCIKCGKENFITTEFVPKKISEVTFEEVHEAIYNASNMMDDKQIKECAKEYYKGLKKKQKK